MDRIADEDSDELVSHGTRAEVLMVSTKKIMIGLQKPREWYWGHKQGEPTALRGLMDHRTRNKHKTYTGQGRQKYERETLVRWPRLDY